MSLTRHFVDINVVRLNYLVIWSLYPVYCIIRVERYKLGGEMQQLEKVDMIGATLPMACDAW